MSIVAEGAIRRHVESIARDQGSQRHHAATQSLTQHQHVRNDPIVFAREHLPSPPQAGGDLVQNEQRAVFVTRGPHPPPVVRRRYERRGAHGLADDRGDVTFLFEDVLDVVGALEPAFAAAIPRAMPGIRRRHMLAARQQRAEARAEERLTPDGTGLDRGAVEGVPHRDGLVPAGRHAGELQGHADGFGAPGGEEDPVEIARGQRGQLAGERNRGRVRVPAWAEREFLQLADDCGDDPRIPKTDLVHAVAVEIQVRAPLQVFDLRAATGTQHIQARRGQRLVQEPAGVLVEAGAGIRIEHVRLPGRTLRRGVDVTFGGGLAS